MSAPVLIVDDSLTVRMDLAQALGAVGLRTVLCASLAEAREAIAREAVALIILDVLLPDGDGIELLAELRTRPNAAAATVLLLSTEVEVRDRVRGLRTGADEYVGKPYDTSYVVARAQELLRGREATRASGASSVLVIDDSATFREALREALVGAGYEVLTAASGEEGLRVAASARPSAVVVDGVLPGVDGPTVIRRIRLDPALQNLPCVLLTASQEQNAELQALDAGADAFVRKHDDLRLLLAQVGAAIRRGGSLSSPARVVSALGPKKILTVDDSLTYLGALSSALRGEGYDVVQARSGEEALELLSIQPVDCILLDLLMPGIGGEETCRRLKSVAATRDTPLIMMTALEDRDAMIAGLVAGADDYIQKSSDLEVLKARVRAQIRRKQFEDETRRIRDELMREKLEAAEARAARELAETRAALIEQLERKNRELEAFSYSVSHDLRAPLRAIDGFSQALLEDHAAALDPRGQDYLWRVRAAAQRMGELIDDLLDLSRVGRAELKWRPMDLSALAQSVLVALSKHEPERLLSAVVRPGLWVEADARLIRIVLENLLGNAWKFTRLRPESRIELGALEADAEGMLTCFVRDNGVGFDMRYAAKLFRPFQRLHAESEYPGTGVGLATVARIVDRHGGRVWAESELGVGATIYFTLRAAVTGQVAER